MDNKIETKLTEKEEESLKEMKILEENLFKKRTPIQKYKNLQDKEQMKTTDTEAILKKIIDKNFQENKESEKIIKF